MVLTWVINKAFFGWTIDLSYPTLPLGHHAPLDHRSRSSCRASSCLARRPHCPGARRPIRVARPRRILVWRSFTRANAGSRLRSRNHAGASQRAVQRVSPNLRFRPLFEIRAASRLPEHGKDGRARTGHCGRPDLRAAVFSQSFITGKRRNFSKTGRSSELKILIQPRSCSRPDRQERAAKRPRPCRPMGFPRRKAV